MMHLRRRCSCPHISAWLLPSLVSDLGCAAQSLECRTLRAGQTVVVQGDVGDEFFFILSGSVDVTMRRKSPHGSDVDSHIAVLRAGHHFGDLALMGPPGATRRASVSCQVASVFAVLRRSAYDQCAPPCAGPM